MMLTSSRRTQELNLLELEQDLTGHGSKMQKSLFKLSRTTLHFFSPLEHNKKIASPRAPGGAKKKYMYLTELDLLGLVTSEHKWAEKELFLHTLNNFITHI